MVQDIKDYLYEKWKKNNDEIYWESIELGEEFRKRGCPKCGLPGEGNGQWKFQAKMVWVCPHLNAFVNRRLKSKLDHHIAMLEFIQKGCPFQDLLSPSAESLILLSK